MKLSEMWKVKNRLNYWFCFYVVSLLRYGKYYCIDIQNINFVYCNIYQISLHGIKANTFTICTPLSWPYKGKKMFCLVQHSVGALSYKFERNILKNQYWPYAMFKVNSTYWPLRKRDRLLVDPRKRILRRLFECNIVFPTMVEKRADVYKVMVGYAPVE